MSSPTPSSRSRRIPLLAGLVALLTVVGGVSASAVLSTTGQATTSATTDAVAVSQAGFDSTATTLLPSRLTTTRSFSVTNDSAIPGTATVTVSGTGARTAAATLTVWPVASAGACTDAAVVPSNGTTSGTLGALGFSTGVLAAHTTQVYCARTVIADWKSTTVTDPSGSWSVAMTSTVSIDASGWSASAAALTRTERAEGVYPLLTGTFFDASKANRWHTLRWASTDGTTQNCLDVNGGGTAAGSAVLSRACQTDPPQRWEFLPVSGGIQSLVTLRPRHAPTMRLATSAAGSLSIQTAASNDPTQQWYVQRVSTSQYQLVSASTGKCVPVRPQTGQTGDVAVDCNDAAAALRLSRETFTFSQAPLCVALGLCNVTVAWPPGGKATTDSASITLQRQTGPSTWATMTTSTGSATVAGTATSITFAPVVASPSTYRVVFGGAGGTDVLFGPFVLTNSLLAYSPGAGFD